MLAFLIGMATGLLLAQCALAGDRLLLVANWSSQLVQNARADTDDLSRMRDRAMVQRFHRRGYLVAVQPGTRCYYLHAIASAYWYCRPWTKLFLERIARQHYAHFGRRLRVTSLVRTVAQQLRLTRVNLNAASATGARRSSHLTGATLDVSKRFMSRGETSWMRRVLYSLRRRGYLYAIEEFHQPAFHIMVYRNYAQYALRRDRKPRAGSTDIALASSRQSAAALE
ncbi:MAG: DUF5715 family protein [Bryobacteraceae bacterium]